MGCKNTKLEDEAVKTAGSTTENTVIVESPQSAGEIKEKAASSTEENNGSVQKKVEDVAAEPQISNASAIMNDLTSSESSNDDSDDDEVLGDWFEQDDFVAYEPVNTPEHT